MTWTTKLMLKRMPKFNKPILIEGLPGIGNVGKVAVDFIIDDLKAKKLLEFRSYTMPHSVFVTEDNLVELPMIELYYKKTKKGSDLLFLSGDIQPTEEVTSYEFSYKVLEVCKELGVKKIITTGGIGLGSVPENPRLFCTGNSKDVVKKFIKGTKASDKLHGVVGPIVGVTGLLVGLATETDIEAVCLLAETYAHPLYLGMNGSKQMLILLKKKLRLPIDLKSLDEEIKEVEKDMLKKTELLAKLPKKQKIETEVSYIG